jgi:hypothetical protein
MGMEMGLGSSDGGCGISLARVGSNRTDEGARIGWLCLS